MDEWVGRMGGADSHPAGRCAAAWPAELTQSARNPMPFGNSNRWRRLLSRKDNVTTAQGFSLSSLLKYKRLTLERNWPPRSGVVMVAVRFSARIRRQRPCASRQRRMKGAQASLTRRTPCPRLAPWTEVHGYPRGTARAVRLTLPDRFEVFQQAVSRRILSHTRSGRSTLFKLAFWRRV